ncbi:Uncharacterized protein Fot_33146 [Forsythia ovata]|uniref:Uncharacterized protein n=1 Tax=Forsythia ovata TaxID=205694 RepID=A0ABD1T9Y2_9LAMI
MAQGQRFRGRKNYKDIQRHHVTWINLLEVNAAGNEYQGTEANEVEALANENAGAEEAELEAVKVELEDPNNDTAEDDPDNDGDTPNRPGVDPEPNPDAGAELVLVATPFENEDVDDPNGPLEGVEPDPKGTDGTEADPNKKVAVVPVEAPEENPKRLDVGAEPNPHKRLVVVPVEAPKEDPKGLDVGAEPDPKKGMVVLPIEVPEEIITFTVSPT